MIEALHSTCSQCTRSILSCPNDYPQMKKTGHTKLQTISHRRGLCGDLYSACYRSPQRDPSSQLLGYSTGKPIHGNQEKQLKKPKQLNLTKTN